MSMPTVFIDGDAGTTGLRIRELLAEREDFELVRLPDDVRKDRDARREAFRRADVVVLCLPDAAAREAAEWGAAETRILDASSAHRVSPDWVYGLPELCGGQRERIRSAQRVTNPGCHATGAILCLRPLIDAGCIDAGAALFVRSLSGYSGGGKELIARYEAEMPELLQLPADAPYALSAPHKHLPEIARYARLRTTPHFIPAVGPFHSGMRVEIPLHADTLRAAPGAKQIWEVLRERYLDEAFVRVAPWVETIGRDEARFDPRAFAGTNQAELSVFPHADGHVLLMARFDNLGKGASAAAVQNLNLMLGVPEAQGLSG